MSGGGAGRAPGRSGERVLTGGLGEDGGGRRLGRMFGGILEGRQDLRWNENKGRHQEGYRGESSDDLGKGAPGAMLLGHAWGLRSGGAQGTVLQGMFGGGSWGMLGRVLECRTVDNDDGDENEERETASLTMQCMTSNNMLQGKLEQENHLREHQTLTLKI